MEVLRAMALSCTITCVSNVRNVEPGNIVMTHGCHAMEVSIRMLTRKQDAAIVRPNAALGIVSCGASARDLRTTIDRAKLAGIALQESIGPMSGYNVRELELKTRRTNARHAALADLESIAGLKHTENKSMAPLFEMRRGQFVMAPVLGTPRGNVRLAEQDALSGKG